jgi:hypothetical protein
MYLKMLEEEMRTSDHFTKENFGLQIGDGYPDLVREIVKSDNLTGRLLIGLITSSLSGRELALSMKKGMAEHRQCYPPEHQHLRYAAFHAILGNPDRTETRTGVGKVACRT